MPWQCRRYRAFCLILYGLLLLYEKFYSVFLCSGSLFYLILKGLWGFFLGLPVYRPGLLESRPLCGSCSASSPSPSVRFACRTRSQDAYPSYWNFPIRLWKDLQLPHVPCWSFLTVWIAFVLPRLAYGTFHSFEIISVCSFLVLCGEVSPQHCWAMGTR